MRGVPTREVRHNDAVPAEVRDFFWRIAAHDAGAMTWRVDEFITFCVTRRPHPEEHRIIDSIELRNEARRLITKYQWPMVNDQDPDAVLVLGSAL